jgi:hypothetical protein
MTSLFQLTGDMSPDGSPPDKTSFCRIIDEFIGRDLEGSGSDVI